MNQIASSVQASHASFVDAASRAVPLLVPVGRALFSAIFIMASFGHFSQASIGMAAAEGVPLAALAVPLSGIMSLIGGLSILFGYHARLGALLLVGFLVPVTLMMHKFWAIGDPMLAQMHMAMFLKNVALTGAALLIVHFGAGPLSIDARRRAR